MVDSLLPSWTKRDQMPLTMCCTTPASWLYASSRKKELSLISGSSSRGASPPRRAGTATARSAAMPSAAPARRATGRRPISPSTSLSFRRHGEDGDVHAVAHARDGVAAEDVLDQPVAVGPR